jgi:phenylalanyl-tRNA synthetase beta chain
MKILLSWLAEFAPEGLGPIGDDPEALGDVLTNLGLVVESIETSGPAWDGIVVAKVLELAKHPEADRIQLVQVDTGGAASPAGEPLQICCGAFNMSVGDLVPLATIGTTMGNGMEIAQRKMRGQTSNGMLCSAAELDMGDDADAEGIFILDAGMTIGMALSEAMGSASEIVFDLDVEGNRPDALSVMGVARDVCAKLEVPFAPPAPAIVEAGPDASQMASALISDSELCKRFGARVLTGLEIGPSPSWMQARLTAAGMRPISNIVDISNYVMLELGQPNHTYDLAKVPDGQLIVRMAEDGEKLVTLDGVERTASASDGLICDSSNTPIGLAGVMGGESTEISDSTTSVLLEAAVWDPMTIAKTSRRLNLRSEASLRFERGADPLGIERALDRFAELAVQHCGATVAKGQIITEGGFAPTPPVRLRTAKCNTLLSTELTTAEIAGYLAKIGFESTPDGDDAIVVQVPSWRPDSAIEEDLIEEVGRHHGYEKSGKLVPVPEAPGSLTPAQTARRKIRRAFLAAGCSEAMPLPFLAPEDLSKAQLSNDGISLVNPLVHEESILRTSLLPGLLKAIAYNQSHRSGDVALFELGKVYIASDGDLPDEPEHVAAVLSGATAADATELVHQVAAILGLSGLRLLNGQRAGLHPGRSAEIQFRGRLLGEVGEVHPDVSEAFGIDGRVGWVRFVTAPIVNALAKPAKYKPISLYPSSDLDLAFVLANATSAHEVSVAISKAGAPLVRSVQIFDVFRGSQLGDDRRSLAFNIRLQADGRTLSEADVSDCRLKMIEAVTSKFGAELRG